MEVFAEDSLEALVLCAQSWEPEARLLGNVRAATIAQLGKELIERRNSDRRRLNTPNPGEPEERDWFCVECGVLRLGVSYDGGAVEEDGTCASCGNGAARLSQVRALLATAGMRVVTPHQQAVLDAMAAASSQALRSFSHHGYHHSWISSVCTAELALREAAK